MLSYEYEAKRVLQSEIKAYADIIDSAVDEFGEEAAELADDVARHAMTGYALKSVELLAKAGGKRNKKYRRAFKIIENTAKALSKVRKGYLASRSKQRRDSFEKEKMRKKNEEVISDRNYVELLSNKEEDTNLDFEKPDRLGPYYDDYKTERLKYDTKQYR